MTTGTDTDSLAPHSAITAGPAAALRQRTVLEEKIRNGSLKQRQLRHSGFPAPPEQHGRSLAEWLARMRWIGRAWPDLRPQPRDDSGSRARVPDDRRLPACRKLC